MCGCNANYEVASHPANYLLPQVFEGTPFYYGDVITVISLVNKLKFSTRLIIYLLCTTVTS
jgi:hypothetical protein